MVHENRFRPDLRKSICYRLGKVMPDGWDAYGGNVIFLGFSLFPKLQLGRPVWKL